MPRSFSDVVAALGGSAGIAELCDVSKNTASSWCRRRSIPLRVWPQLVGSAAGIASGLTNDELVAIHVGLTTGIDPSVPQEDAA